MAIVSVLVIILQYLFISCLADICLEYNLNPYGYDTDGRYLVCPGGCCGTRYAKYCCDETRWYDNAGVVPGLVETTRRPGPGDCRYESEDAANTHCPRQYLPRSAAELHRERHK